METVTVGNLALQSSELTGPLTEVRQIRALILADAQIRRPAVSTVLRPSWVIGLALLELLAYLVMSWSAIRGLAALGRTSALVVLGLPLVLLVCALRDLRMEWVQRRHEAVRRAVQQGERQDGLFEQLHAFEPHALRCVAAEFDSRESTVMDRAAAFIGPAKAGGLLGMGAILFGGVATVTRVLPELQVGYGSLMGQVVVNALVVFTACGVGALFATSNVSSLKVYSSLLRRVADAKQANRSG